MYDEKIDFCHLWTIVFVYKIKQKLKNTSPCDFALNGDYILVAKSTKMKNICYVCFKFPCI